MEATKFLKPSGKRATNRWQRECAALTVEVWAWKWNFSTGAPSSPMTPTRRASSKVSIPSQKWAAWRRARRRMSPPTRRLSDETDVSASHAQAASSLFAAPPL